MSASSMNPGRPNGRRWPTVVFLACLCASLWAFSVGWNHSIVDRHGFRQAQTAISVRYLLQGSPWLTYETPVLGAPWSVPFEFPLYQWLAALGSLTLGIPVDQSGRLVSVLFFYLLLLPLSLLLGQFGVRPGDRLLLLSLILTSPLYLFWSRALMIESLALFLAVTFLACLVRWQGTADVKWAMLGALSGVLAAAVKITTLYGFLLGAAVLMLVDFLRTWRARASRSLVPDSTSIRHYLQATVSFLVLPLLTALLWTRFTDRVRDANPLAREFLGSRALEGWIWGSPELRGDPGFWHMLLWGRTAADAAGHHAALLLVAGTIALARKRRTEALTCLALYLAVPMTFANLHAVHDYYAYANGIFLLGALGFGTLGLLEGDTSRRRLAFFLLPGFLALGFTGYSRGYLQVQRRDHRDFMPLADTIQRLTHPEDVVLIYGWDWSPELPYLAQRRALMDRAERPLGNPAMRAALINLRRERRRLGVLAVCSSSRSHTRLVAHAQRNLGFAEKAVYSDAICDLYPAAGTR